MTISTTIIKVSYSGNGTQTVFPYTFKISAEADIQVIIRASNGTETVKTLTTDYSVSGVGSASGGNVTMVTAPSATETIVIRRETTQTQTVDLVENDPFTAETVEGAFDKSVAIAQELQEEVDRSIKLSRTNTMTSTEFTVDAATRANKVLAFDSAGEIAVTQELGTYKGNWAASTSYNERDLVKDTTTNNIFISNTAHTSSGSLPLTTNTDSAKWDLLVDAASATASASAAATSATNSANSATASANSASAAASSESNAATSESNAATSASNASTSATNASNSATAAANSASAAEAYADNFDDAYLGAKASNPSVDNDGDPLDDGALYFDTTNNVMKVYDLGTTTWYQLTPTVANQANINIVSGISNEIQIVAGDSTDIQTVASDSADIQALADIEDGTVATNAVSNAGNNSTNIATVAGQISPTNNIATVATANANISTVAGQISPTNNIATVAGANANITTIATDLNGSNTIGTVATDLSGTNNIGTVAGSIVNVNQVGSNIGTVNEFGERYRVGSSDPTTSLDAGDLAFNTTANALKYYNGSTWEAIVAGGLTDIVQDGTPQLGGDLDVNGNSIVSVSGGDIAITPDTTGKVVIDGLNYPTADGASGQAIVTDGSGNLSFGTTSSPEVYGFELVDTDADGVLDTLRLTTTNQGADNISASDYAAFNDVIYGASGMTWSLTANGDLRVTI